MRYATVAVWLNSNPDTIAFYLDIYGYSPREIRMIPTGAAIVKRALRVVGIDPDTVTCNLFAVW